MYSINNIELAFSGIPLLKGISFVINKKDRIGLTGKNGAGKSTLLKIITGLQEYDKGSISFPSDTTIGYLPQQMIYPEGKTVIDETLTAFSDINKLKEKIETLGNELAERTDYESDSYLKLIEHYTRLQERYTFSGAEHADASAEKMLKGLGFLPSDFNRQADEFSGGWRMRIELAKILLQTPDILLLDEPTNHLDIESVAWLEQFLKSYNGAVLLISHDRLFLDTVTNRTIEIVKGNIYDYKAAYSKFEILRKERIEVQKSAYINQQKMIAETEKFIERFRYKATKAVQVQSRIKQLEKIERIEIDEEDISALSFKFPPAPRSGDISFDIENLTKRYGNDAPVLENIYLTIERGEKIAFVGKNGQGKTTLARILMQELDFDGNMKIGHNVNIGYFAQNQDKALDESKTVFETLDDIAVGDIRTKVRDILGKFLFRGEDIEKKVAVLSGGERSRLALAKLMLEPYNVLILDEPTNHLDMHSKDILKQALQSYDGTLILVSHDRDFLIGLPDKIYEFGNKKIKQHGGDIMLFMQKKNLEQLNDITKKEKTNSGFVKSGESDNKKLYLLRKEHEKKIRKAEKLVANCEADIEGYEAFIGEAEAKLASGNFVPDDDFYKDFEKAKRELEKSMYEWEILHEQLEDLENQRTNLQI